MGKGRILLFTAAVVTATAFYGSHRFHASRYKPKCEHLPGICIYGGKEPVPALLSIKEDIEAGRTKRWLKMKIRQDYFAVIGTYSEESRWPSNVMLHDMAAICSCNTSSDQPVQIVLTAGNRLIVKGCEEEPCYLHRAEASIQGIKEIFEEPFPIELDTSKLKKAVVDPEFKTLELDSEPSEDEIDEFPAVVKSEPKFWKGWDWIFGIGSFLSLAFLEVIGRRRDAIRKENRLEKEAVIAKAEKAYFQEKKKYEKMLAQANGAQQLEHIRKEFAGAALELRLVPSAYWKLRKDVEAFDELCDERELIIEHNKAIRRREVRIQLEAKYSKKKKELMPLLDLVASSNEFEPIEKKFQELKKIVDEDRVYYSSLREDLEEVNSCISELRRKIGMEEEKKKEEFVAYYEEKMDELIGRLKKAKTLEECDEIGKKYSALGDEVLEKHPRVYEEKIDDFRMFRQFLADKIEFLGGPIAPHFSYCDPVK